MSHAIAITCQGVSKRFPLTKTSDAWRPVFGLHEGPVFEALKDVSFDVPKGQFVGVLGRNGAGKSTLLRVLGGVYSADEGQIILNGALSGLYELGLVGHPQLTGRAYADRLLTVHGFSRARREAMIDDAHEFSELGDRFDDPVLTYSAGMCARLFFSVATAGDYEVYLIDEVLSVGDQHFQSKCWRRLRDRVSRGASGILVTHDWSAIMRLCETTHILRNGQIDYSGPSEQAVRYYLYGDQARQSYDAGIGKVLGEPAFPRTVAQGEAFHVAFDVAVETGQQTFFTMAIERLQPGFGWETLNMTRKPEPVSTRPGRYRVEFTWGHMALASGDYRLSGGLLVKDPEMPGRYLVGDGVTWLNGQNVTFTVEGEPKLDLPMRWSKERCASHD